MKENKKASFHIVTSHGEFKRNLLTLKALGYPVYWSTLQAAEQGGNMDNFTYLTYDAGKDSVCRSHQQYGLRFQLLDDFLVWYLDDETPEDKRIKAIDIEIRSLELEKAGLVAKKTGAVC